MLQKTRGLRLFGKVGGMTWVALVGLILLTGSLLVTG
jgi:hypothetical protein